MMSLNPAHQSYDSIDEANKPAATTLDAPAVPMTFIPRFGTSNIANASAYPPVRIGNRDIYSRTSSAALPVGFSNEAPTVFVTDAQSLQDQQAQYIYNRVQKRYSGNYGNHAGRSHQTRPRSVSEPAEYHVRRHHEGHIDRTEQQQQHDYKHSHHHHHTASQSQGQISNHRRSASRRHSGSHKHHEEVVVPTSSHRHAHRRSNTATELLAVSNKMNNLSLKGSQSSHAILNSPTGETVFRNPVVQETVRTDVVTEIQPIITRHVEQPVIHHVEKHIYESAPSAAGTVTREPIIREIIHPVIIEEVQEIVHREVPVVETERVEQLTEEKIVLPTEHSSEVLTETLPPLAQAGYQAGGPAPVLPRTSKLAAGLETMAAKLDGGNNMTKVPTTDPATGLETIPRSNGISSGFEKQAAKMDSRNERRQAKKIGTGAN